MLLKEREERWEEEKEDEQLLDNPKETKTMGYLKRMH
jgi:hypothetical protein